MKKFFGTAAAAAAIFVTSYASTAQSAEKASTTKSATENGSSDRASTNGLMRDLTKVSDDGYSALRSIHAARIAIFNGEAKRADELLDKAKTDLDAATKDAHTFAVDSKAADHGKKGEDKSASDEMDMIPIDGDVAIADTFVPSTEKQKHVDKANEHLKSGHSKEAIEELRLGEIDVVFTRVLLPLKMTKKHVAAAEKLTNEHKFYEANLALLAAERGLVVDSVDLLGTPDKSSSGSSSSSSTSSDSTRSSASAAVKK